MTFHIEAVDGPSGAKEVVDALHAAGLRAGVAVKPDTGVDALGDVGDMGVDMVLVMTVEPGFGGQSFMPETMDKVSALRAAYPTLDIQVDGGLSPATIDVAAAAGANVVVAGSAIFKADSRADVISTLRSSIDQHRTSAS